MPTAVAAPAVPDAPGPDDAPAVPAGSPASRGRRRLLRDGVRSAVVGLGAALFPQWMPRLAFADGGAARGDVLVHVFLRGGMDGLSAVVPYSEGRWLYDARPAVAVPEGSAIDLDGRFGLHPALAPLAELYGGGELAIVHAVGSPDPTRSHFDAMQRMEFGTPGETAIGSGWLGRHLESAAWTNDSPFRAVGMGRVVADALRGPVSPLALRSIEAFHFRGREAEMERLRRSLGRLYGIDDGIDDGGDAPADPLGAQASLVFETIDLLRDLDARAHPSPRAGDYPDGEFGMGLMQIAQLIRADVGLEVASVDLGGWDTHERQGTMDGRFAGLMNALARGLHAFWNDLGDARRRVTVVVMSEFGRRLRENGSAGTDHGHGNAMFVLSGGVRGGRVIADWPGLAPERLVDGDLAITTDYRDVLAEILRDRVGNAALERVFPGHRPRPVGLFGEADAQAGVRG